MRRLDHLVPRFGALLLAFAAATAWAQAPSDARVALVIGNGEYKSGALKSSPGDAKAVAKALKLLGFEVVELTDGTRAEMHAALARTQEAMRGGVKIGLLYYSGHALQFGQRNYLIPVDAQLSGPGDVLAQTVDVQAVLEVFDKSGNRSNVFVFDACRDHPFSTSASGSGLAQMEAPPGTFLAFSAAPGEVADDKPMESGRGIYTHHLLNGLGQPGIKLEDLFKGVRFQVRKQSQGRQLPWESTSLEDDFHFGSAGQDSAEAAPPQPAAAGTAANARGDQESFSSEFVLGTTRFSGSFKADPKAESVSGTGNVTWADGSSFEGTLVAGKRQGLGKFSWGNGQRYEGQWQDDQPQGPGMLWFASGDVYEGTVRDGAPAGQGRMRFANGDRYIGDFENGIAHGRGTFTWASGQTMSGQWVQGRVEGPATVRFVNGDVYEGTVLQGRPNGTGRMSYRTGDVYAGQFNAGVPEGEGNYAWPNGDRFVGRWLKGRREGPGVMTWRNGDRWIGRYSADAQAEGEWVAASK